MIERTGRFECRASGHSMLPTIRGGDILEVVPVTSKEMRVGQILLVERGTHSLVCHRLVMRSGDWLTLVGDACLLLDPPTRVENVLGRVIAIHRNGIRHPVDERLPFPHTADPNVPLGTVEYLHVTNDPSCSNAGEYVLTIEKAVALLEQRRNDGVPILALAEQGRGDEQTLRAYAQSRERVVVVSGVLSGYGCNMRYEIDPALVTDAVRPSAISAMPRHVMAQMLKLSSVSCF